MSERIVQTKQGRYEAYCNGQLVGITSTWADADAAIREWRKVVLAQGPVGTGFDPYPSLTAYVIGNERP